MGKQKIIIRIGKFVGVGGALTLFNFVIYTIFARAVFNNNNLLWLNSIISYLITTILAYVMHSKITWRERTVTTKNIIMFFVWNGIMAVAITPFFTWLFTCATWFNQFVFQISSALGLPFDYEFVESTNVFVWVNVIALILNYIFYDRIVFAKKKQKNGARGRT